MLRLWLRRARPRYNRELACRAYPKAKTECLQTGKSVRGKVLSESNETECKTIVEKRGPKLKFVHQQYKSMKAKFLFSNFNVL